MSQGRRFKRDESILSKAKQFVGSEESTSLSSLQALAVRNLVKKVLKTPEHPNPDSEGKKKRQKPRHASEEGQKFLEKKAQLLKASVETPSSWATPPPHRSKGAKKRKIEDPVPVAEGHGEESPKKKRKKSKKKKSKGAQGPDHDKQSKLEKLPETEERQRRESLAYLQLWKEHRDHWKFEKLKQMWLLQNATNVVAIDDKMFGIVLEYIESCKGAARVKTLKDMEEIMAAFERKHGNDNPNSVFSIIAKKKDDGEGEEGLVVEPDDDKRREYHRARQIVQTLSSA